jgi:hypothetical protein
MKMAVSFFVVMLLVPVFCFAEGAAPICPPERVIVKGSEFLAMLAAYEQFKKDQKRANISKLKVSLFNEEDGSVSVLFSYPPKISYGPDGKVLKMVFGDEDRKYGVPVAYYVDPKTNKIIKREYQR